MAKGAEIEVTPEEERFLRRFFRRQALPWLALFAVLAVVSARATAPAGDAGASAALADAEAAIASLRAESAELRTRLDALGQRLPAALERRVAAAESRLSAVEAQPSGGAHPEASSRLARLEARLASADGAQDTLTRSHLARFQGIEARLDRLEQVAPTIPAAPAP